MFAYSNNGNSMRAISPGMELPGEIVFIETPTEEQLQTAFPERGSAKAAELVASRLVDLETKLHDYIYSRYDQGTQSSLIALYVGPQATPKIEVAIEAVWCWIQGVLGQYYGWKAAIAAGGNPDINFIPFDLTDPKVRLEAIMGIS